MDNFTGQNVIEYNKSFATEEQCKSYLEHLKWSDGFQCVICNHDQYFKGHFPFTRACKKCRRIDSVTANTLFHKVKFGLHKAFWIAFEMSTTSKSLSSVQLSKRLGITQKTAWFFMQKVRKSMKSSQRYPLKGEVHVDEFVIGGKEAGKPGRSKDTKKKKVACAVELADSKKIKRFYATTIEDYSSDELMVFFDKHIDQTADITTDQWSSYQVIASQFNIDQVKSDQGKNFPEIHIMIASLKSWIRAIPTHVSKKHLDAYLDEFCYRINRSLFKENIFHNLLERMVHHYHLSWQNITHA